MAVKIIRKGKKINIKIVSDIEAQIGSPLPADFKAFLLENNGGTPETNEFEILSDQNSTGINVFLSSDEILTKKEAMNDRFVKDAWPIAQAEGGNYLCLVFGGEAGVYLWDHETEADENEPPSMGNMLFLAPDFSSFWKSVKKFNPDSVVLKPGQVKSTWSDPNFKPQF